jgi:hypothetical protein
MDRGDNQQEGWLWFSQEDSQKLNDAISNTPTAPLMVEVSKNHTVDLSRWDSHGVATETSGRNGKKYMVRRGAGLPATALIKVSHTLCRRHFSPGGYSDCSLAPPPPPLLLVCVLLLTMMMMMMCLAAVGESGCRLPLST